MYECVTTFCHLQWIIKKIFFTPRFKKHFPPFIQNDVSRNSMFHTFLMQKLLSARIPQKSTDVTSLCSLVGEIFRVSVTGGNASECEIFFDVSRDSTTRSTKSTFCTNVIKKRLNVLPQTTQIPFISATLFQWPRNEMYARRELRSSSLPSTQRNQQELFSRQQP